MFLMALVARAFCYFPPMIALVRAMPVPHRVVGGVLLGAMLLGHFTIRGRTWYPYVVWEIFPFVREEDPVTCPEFIGTTETGRKVRLLVEQLFPSIIQFNPPFDQDGNPIPATDHLVAALAAMYNAHHAADPVRQVDLMVMAVPLHPPLTETRAEPSCELLKSYAISSAP